MVLLSQHDLVVEHDLRNKLPEFTFVSSNGARIIVILTAKEVNGKPWLVTDGAAPYVADLSTGRMDGMDAVEGKHGQLVPSALRRLRAIMKLRASHRAASVPPDMESLEDKQAEVSDAIATARSLIEALECVESCETDSDFKDNVKEAQELLATLNDELADLGK